MRHAGNERSRKQAARLIDEQARPRDALTSFEGPWVTRRAQHYCALGRAARSTLRRAGRISAARLALLVGVSHMAAAQAPLPPGMMAYDLMVGETGTGQTIRLTGHAMSIGSGILVRQCVQPAPFAPLGCQTFANGRPSPPYLVPPLPPVAGTGPGMASLPGPPGWMAGPAGTGTLLAPPPGVPGWSMSASGRGSWRGLAAQGSFTYWQAIPPPTW